MLSILEMNRKYFKREELILIDINILFSIITAVVAVIALFQTNKQMRLSNQQHLFDRRVACYIIAKGLIQLYENNQTLLIKIEDKLELDIGFIFIQMTNNAYLEKIICVIDHPLEQPYQKEFLVKLEMLKNVSTKIRCIFNGNISILLGDYVLCYQEVLWKMYQYQIVVNKMRKVSNDYKRPIEEQEEMTIKPYEEELQKVINKLRQAYEKLKEEKAEEKIEKQIKLK